MVPIFFMVVLIIFYTPIVNKILFPNGKKTFEIIYKLANDEFGNDINKCKTYFDLKNGIIGFLKRLNEREFEEYTLSTLVNIEHFKQNDFGNHIALKFSYWAIILAIVDISTVLNFFETIGLKNKFVFISIIFAFFTIFLLIMINTIRKQHNQLEYLNFKLICINTIKYEKENRIHDIKSRK